MRRRSPPIAQSWSGACSPRSGSASSSNRSRTKTSVTNGCEASRTEWWTSLDSWRQDLRGLRRRWCCASVPEVRAGAAATTAARDARRGFRVRAPSEVPRQSLASRCRARSQAVPRGDVLMARGHGQIRRTQVITTYGPGALIDLPRDSAIVAGLETWPNPSELEEIIEPRLVQKLRSLTGVPTPRLFAPPPPDSEPGKSPLGINACRFPEWFVVQDEVGGADRERSRRLVNRRALDEKRRFDGRRVVATRFVRACPKRPC